MKYTKEEDRVTGFKVSQLLHLIPHSQASVLKRKRSDTKQIFKNSALKIEKKVKTGSLAFSLHVLVT